MINKESDLEKIERLKHRAVGNLAKAYCEIYREWEEREKKRTLEKQKGEEDE